MRETLRGLLYELGPRLQPDTVRFAETDFLGGEYDLCLDLLASALIRDRVPITETQKSSILEIIAFFGFERREIDPRRDAYPHLTDDALTRIVVRSDGDPG